MKSLYKQWYKQWYISHVHPVSLPLTCNVTLTIRGGWLCICVIHLITIHKYYCMTYSELVCIIDIKKVDKQLMHSMKHVKYRYENGTFLVKL